MKTLNRFLRFAVMAAGIASASRAADLREETLDSWKQIVRDADIRMHARLKAGEPFLWIDESAARKRRAVQGEIIAAPAATRGTQSVPGGLVHDWVGAVFIPNVRVKNLLAVLHDYDNYKTYTGRL